MTAAQGHFDPLSVLMPPVTTKPMARWVEIVTGFTD
jgi:formaldehyde-activating enzyme involved in methanogenesis